MNIDSYTDSLIERYGSAMLDKEQTAKELQISECQLDRMRASKSIAYTKVGSQIRFPAWEISSYLFRGMENK